MERYCPDVQLVGMIPKNPDKALEQRYLGLKTLRSFAEREITPLQELTDPIDLDRVLDIAESSPSDLPTYSPYTERSCGLKAAVPVDDSYCFYYEENIECLRASGFEVTTFRPTDGDGLPDADLYYLGALRQHGLPGGPQGGVAERQDGHRRVRGPHEHVQVHHR